MLMWFIDRVIDELSSIDLEDTIIFLFVAFICTAVVIYFTFLNIYFL